MLTADARPPDASRQRIVSVTSIESDTKFLNGTILFNSIRYSPSRKRPSNFLPQTSRCLSLHLCVFATLREISSKRGESNYQLTCFSAIISFSVQEYDAKRPRSSTFSRNRRLPRGAFYPFERP